MASARLWEIDALRGVAVVLMISYHLIWDLAYFDLLAVDVFALPWQVFARGIGTLFLLILGISLRLRAARDPGLNGWALRRGAVLFGLGMLITLVTYLALGPSYVRFGILHVLGCALVLAVPFVRVPAWRAALAALVFIGVGAFLNRQVVPFPWLIWLGVPQAGVVMVDYYPLLPWAGVALLGVAVGRVVYPAGTRRFALPDAAGWLPVRALQFLGQHALLIYLTHQPALFGLVALLAATAAG
jgi:uncharacterized membrane protein